MAHDGRVRLSNGRADIISLHRADYCVGWQSEKRASLGRHRCRGAPTATTMFTPGSLLAQRYRIEARLGHGGFCPVHRVWDILHGRACAIKSQLNLDPEVRRRFVQEAALLKDLAHPNLPRGYDYLDLGEQGQHLVMEYIDGQNLAHCLRERRAPFSEAYALEIVDQVADALEYLHSRHPPIIHRDVKPQNIILTPAGVAKLVDFGLAEIGGDDAPTEPAGGTPLYRAPEQEAGGPTDQRSDVYGLAATLYTLLTETAPQRGAPEPPRRCNPAVSAGVERALLRGLALEPAARWQSVAALRGALRRRREMQLAGRDAVWLAAALLAGIVLTALAGAIRPGPPIAGLGETPPTLTPAPRSPLPLAAPTPLGGGGRIAFVSERTGNEDIYIMRTDGSDLRNLTNSPSAERVPSWSPDGARIAFESNRAGGNWDIYVMDADGSNVVRLTDRAADDFDPDWSADGTKIFFHSHSADGLPRLWMMHADGHNQHPLTEGRSGDWAASAAPDGTRLVFTSGYERPGEIMVLDLETGVQTNLTNSEQHESLPHWSSDGERIIFYSERDGNRELYSMNADGTGQTRLTVNSADDAYAAYSPDSLMIVFASERAAGNKFDIYRANADGTDVIPLTQHPATDSVPVWSWK